MNVDLTSIKLPSVDITQFFVSLNGDYPPSLWFVPILVLAILAVTSIVDAFTGRVPTVPLVVALLGPLLAVALVHGWMPTLERAVLALIPVLTLCLFNFICVQITRHDAFGMGDVKWTAVAAFSFGVGIVFWSWVIGAWVALIWLGLRRIARLFIPSLASEHYEGHAYVHFVPFLLVGLLLSLLFGLQAPQWWHI